MIGGIGGLAGLIALGVQGVQWRAQRRNGHIPPEVRPLLIEMSQVAERLIKRRQLPPWIDEHVFPLRERWEPLAHLTLSADKGDHFQLAAISYHLHSLTLWRIPEIDHDPLGYHEACEAQGTHARGLSDSVTDMYLRLSGQRPIAPRFDESDRAPSQRRRWRRAANLR